jgi:hypothetical protein
MLLIGTTEGVFVCSVSGSPEPTDLAQRRISVLRQTTGALFAGCEDGVYRSNDGGRAWRRVGVEDREVLEIAVSSDPQLLYAGTRPAALFRSEDGGATWTEVHSFAKAFDPDTWGLPVPSWPPGARAHSIVADGFDRCLVGVEVGGVVITEDGGETWQISMPGGDPDIHVIVADPRRPSSLFASTGFGRIGKLAEQPDAERIAGMFSSNDGGQTWQFLWEGMNRQYTRPLCIDPRPPYAVTVGVAHSARPYITYGLNESADARLYQSVDGGASWRSLGDQAHDPSFAPLLCVAPALSGAGDVLVGTDRGEVWHVDAAASRWDLLASGIPPVQAVLPLG